MEVLDSGGPDEGYRYRVAAFGLSMEMFTCPGAKLLTVGSLVLPRIVRTAAELFLPMPMEAPPLMFIAPGQNVNGYPELYQYDGVSAPAGLWMGDIENEYITALAWCTATERLIICLWDFDNYQNRILSLDISAAVGVGNPTELVSAYQVWPGYGDTEPANDVAEWQGYLWICHAGWYGGGALMQLDPSTGANSWLISDDWTDYGHGGVAALPDESLMYYCDGIRYWEIEPTAFGTTELLDLSTEGLIEPSGMVANPGDGFVYAGGGYDDAVEGSRIYKLSSASAVEEFSIGPQGSGNLVQVAPEYQAGVVTALWAGMWGYYESANGLAWRRDGGGWPGAATLNRTGDDNLPVNQTMLSFQDKMFFLVQIQTSNDIELWCYDPETTGFAKIETWAGRDFAPTYQQLMAMTVARSGQLCHEVV